MKLIGAVTEGSGAVNEDGWGYTGTPDDVTAAWVLDGVTGINGKNYLSSGTDAAWLVERAHKHLLKLAALDMSLREIISRLVQSLIADWHDAAKGVDLHEDYDPPAACLILAKRYDDGWQAARLGDSSLLARQAGGRRAILAASPNNAFDRWLAAEAAKRRAAGARDNKALLAEFQPQLAQGRKLRNRAGGYSILEANISALEFAEYIDLGKPSEIMLCTDGYFRAVDHYAMYSEAGVLDASSVKGGVNSVLEEIRAVEAADPNCEKFPRFKPADDATAIVLRQSAPN
jgi:Protein phosphatase 2C